MLPCSPYDQGMQCNIDRRGSSIRIAIAVVHLVAASILGVLMLLAILTSPWWWAALAILLAVGAFTLFEGVNGWCAVRAMGFHTPF